MPRQDATVNYLIYASMGVVSIVVFMSCMFLCRQICPNGPVFTALELDEIQLERLNDIEENIERNIRALQQKLTMQKQKKEGYMKDRILNLLSPDNNNHTKAGNNDYDYETTPFKQSSSQQYSANRPSPILNSLVKDSRKSPTTGMDYSRNSKFAKKFDFPDIEHKGNSEAEEKEDMWKLWNKVYDKGDTKKASKYQEDMIKDDSQHSKGEYAYKSIKYGDKSKSFTNNNNNHNKKVDVPSQLTDSYAKQPQQPSSSSSGNQNKYDRKGGGGGGKEEEEDYNHGLEKINTNIMMNLKPLSSNIQNNNNVEKKTNNGNAAVTYSPMTSNNNTSNASQYQIKVPLHNYDANNNSNKERLDPTVPRPRPAPPKHPPPLYSTTSSASSVPVAAAPLSGGGGVGSGSLRARAPMGRPPPPKGPPPKLQSGDKHE